MKQGKQPESSRRGSPLLRRTTFQLSSVSKMCPICTTSELTRREKCSISTSGNDITAKKSQEKAFRGQVHRRASFQQHTRTNHVVLYGLPGKGEDSGEKWRSVTSAYHIVL